MADDDDQMNHQKKIQTLIKVCFCRIRNHHLFFSFFSLLQTREQSSLCGLSNWKAAGEDSLRSKKNVDITGSVVTSCNHGSIVYSSNMFKGETFKHTHLQHIKAHEGQATFFCSDVVCKYWPFAEKVGQLFPEYAELTQDMQPFLSRFHGRGHSWDCRVS